MNPSKKQKIGNEPPNLVSVQTSMNLEQDLNIPPLLNIILPQNEASYLRMNYESWPFNKALHEKNVTMYQKKGVAYQELSNEKKVSFDWIYFELSILLS